MNTSISKKMSLRLTILALTIVIFTAGCSGGYIGYNMGNGPESEKPETTTKQKKGGPPPHAPAHGYRAKHNYRYYPSESVYYDTGRRLYFYLKGSNWEVGVSLPDKLKVNLGDYVTLELATDRPYIYHAEHKKKYPPGQLKQKQKKHKKWALQ